MATAYLKRRVIVLQLWRDAKLTTPPCFAPDMWTEFLCEAASWQRPGHSGPLHIDPKGQDLPKLNLAFNFCQDCDPQHMRAKAREGKCQPDHLIKNIGGTHAKRVLPKPPTP